MSNSANTKRIAKNTGLLYIRTLLTMFVSLYTSRVVLNTLGIEDFGIYNVVGGIVVMFSFLNSAMSSATQRYFSFELGQGNTDQLKKLFSITVNIHFLIAIVITLLAETVGLWFLNTKLNIPADKMYEANWVFQFSIATFFLTVISVPYNAAIISHERMGVYAYVSIFEVLAKLGVVYILVLTQSEKLIWYAGMLFAVALFVRIFYGIYSKRNFTECTYEWIKDKKKSIELMHYAGWNLFGNLAGVGFTQGLNMLLNIFFGPVVNTANGIANQVNGAITSFIGNFQAALNPQIVKSYASDNKEYMQKLIFQGSRFSFYLLLLLTLPVIYQTEYILTLWLKTVPEYAVIFTQLILVNALINSLSGTLMTAAQATGRIKAYQAIVGGLLLMNVPVSYVFLELGYSASSVIYVMIVISVIATIARLIILEQLGAVSISAFLKDVVANVTLVALSIGIVLYFLLPLVASADFAGFIITSFLIVVISIISISAVGLQRNERTMITSKLNQLKLRFI